MQAKTVAILESRGRDQIANLIASRGGKPLLAPALAEVPDADPAQIRALIDQWTAEPPDVFIFQTGVGTRALFDAALSLGLLEKLLQALEKPRIIARGPKPSAVLRARSVRIDYVAPEPFTTQEVLAGLQDIALAGKEIVVQRYGETNWELMEALPKRGAHVTEVATYRWAVPEDRRPLLTLIDALGRNEIDLVAFTSAVQSANLFCVAREAGKEAMLHQSLGRTLVASIGPVCSAALRKLGVQIDIEASPPKLGAFIDAIDKALSASGPLHHPD